MIDNLRKLWHCWVSDRMHRKPHWKTWIRLLASCPVISDGKESDPYYRIYRDKIESGQYKAEPIARGKWVRGEWLMRNNS